MHKTLVIGLSVFGLCFCTHAAQIQWTFTTSKASLVGTTYNGATVYMILADSVPSTITSAADITSAAVSSHALTIGSLGGSTGAVTYDSSSLAESTAYSWYAYVISTDGLSYYKSLTAASSTAVNSDTGTPVSGKYASTTELSSASNWTSFSTVPEPASVGLLLLGLCALGLKRKVA